MKTDEEVRMDGGAFPDDAWLERLLSEDAARQTHIDDAGFSSTVMAALPPPRKSVGRWLVPAMTVAGCLLAALFTPAGEYFARGLVQLTDYRHFTPSHLLVLVPIAMVYLCSFGAIRET